MADNAPLKFIDIKKGLGDALSQLRNQSLAATILPGQGGIPAASPEFLAANPHLVGRNGMPNRFSGESLAGTLGTIGDSLITEPGRQAIEDRQDRGFFAETLRRRLQGI